MTSHLDTQDFYSGFEGEDEVTFTLLSEEGPVRIVRIWAGYFDSLIEQVSPGKDGWHSLARHHHLLTGWESHDHWEVDSLSEARVQWMEIDPSHLPSPQRQVHSAVLSMFNDALAKKLTLRISKS